MSTLEMKAVKREKRHQLICDKLAKSDVKDKTSSLFPTIRDLMLFAAILGYTLEKRKALIGELEDIQEQIFRNNTNAMEVVAMIALAESQNIDVLRTEKLEEMVKIFEEYANGGLYIITRWLSNSPTDIVGFDTLIDELKNLDFIPQVERKKASGEGPSF